MKLKMIACSSLEKKMENGEGYCCWKSEFYRFGNSSAAMKRDAFSCCPRE